MQYGTEYGIWSGIVMICKLNLCNWKIQKIKKSNSFYNTKQPTSRILCGLRLDSDKYEWKKMLNSFRTVVTVLLLQLLMLYTTLTCSEAGGDWWCHLGWWSWTSAAAPPGMPGSQPPHLSYNSPSGNNENKYIYMLRDRYRHIRNVRFPFKIVKHFYHCSFMSYHRFSFNLNLLGYGGGPCWP